MSKESEKLFLLNNSPQSIMRLSFNRTVKTSIFVGVWISVGAVTGFILGICLKSNLSEIAACIGALAGLAGAIIAAYNIPAYKGKSDQAKYELENKVDKTV